MGLAPDAGSPADAVTGEARWPMAVAVTAVMVVPLPGLHRRHRVQPTDAMPLTPRAKIAMTVQSLVSLAILGLIIARAVNVLT
jgi:hypothetical protein